MQYQRVRKRHLRRIGNDFKRVLHPCILGHAPGFVVEQPVAMLTAGRGLVMIAVMSGMDVVHSSLSFLNWKCPSSIRVIGWLGTSESAILKRQIHGDTWKKSGTSVNRPSLGQAKLVEPKLVEQ
jgi:hypothetical protein